MTMAHVLATEPQASDPTDAPQFGVPATDATTASDDLLQRIDETLDLIAAAQSIATGAMPLDRVDVSILVPVYNAAETLPEILDRLEEVMPPATETIVIDDGSTDDTWQVIRHRMEQYDKKQPKNEESTQKPARPRLLGLHRRRHHGRGSAIRMAVRHARGAVIAIQDADLAYDPADLLGAIWPILEDKADVVYGSRTLRHGYATCDGWAAWWSRLGRRCLTAYSNQLTGLRLSDVTVGQKVFRADLLRELSLSETGVGFDAEVTAKVARRADTIMEIPTHFDGQEQLAFAAPRWETLRDVLRSGWQHRAG